MTAQEMSLEFDILYNNIMSNAAPSIDEYEKSVFLTKAQETLVTTIYDSSFENSERFRECLDVLIESKTLNSQTDIQITSATPVSNLSKFFKKPEDMWYIVYEALQPISEDKCISNRNVLVRPVTLDEYYKISLNPFKKPRKNEAFRLNTLNFLEIISIYPEYNYLLRYLRKPKPIIIGTGYSDLYINGYSTETDIDCELSDIIHRTIIDTAVALAVTAYKQYNTNTNKES